MESAIKTDGFWTSAAVPVSLSPRPNPTETPRVAKAPRKRLAPQEIFLQEQLAKTGPPFFTPTRPEPSQALQQLATPREPGASERTQRRAFSREYAAYAQEVAEKLLPGVAAATSESFRDVWRTSGDDGYKSAIFYAAVRCRELQRNAGIEEISDDSSFVFHSGGGEGPELFRLQQACLLLDELCLVASPLRDTLRFLQREILNCTFANYKPGADILQLTPFFVLRAHELAQGEADRQRALAADKEIEALKCRLEEAKKQVQSLKQELQKERQAAQRENETYEMVVAQRNELRQKVEFLRQSNGIRFEELRETNAELSSVQAASYLVRKDLDQARKDMSSMNSQLKESNTRVATLSKRVHDLQDAIVLMSNGDVHKAIPVSGGGGQPVHLEIPPELDMELSIVTRGGSKRKNTKKRNGAMAVQRDEATDRNTSTVDGRRLLKALLPHGGFQVVLKGTVDDPVGLQPAMTPAVSAAAAAVSRRGGKEGIPPVLIVSGEAFAALAISQGLPAPPDPLQYGAHDDEALVKEVGQEVQILTEEYGMLLDLYRGLRQDLKRTLRLVPDYNTDELRGALMNVMVLDTEERVLVPAPVLETEFIGLGEGQSVPPYLRFVGSVSVKPLSTDTVMTLVQEIWKEKTKHVLVEEERGRPQMALDVFLNEKFLPTKALSRPDQMEVMYNFLLAVRQSTTLQDPTKEEGDPLMQNMPHVAKRQSRVGRGRRRSSGVGLELARRPSQSQIAVAEVCPTCGNMFAPDAIFCRMCRTKRPGADGLKHAVEEQEVCTGCGNVFMPDAVFCRKCGAEKPQKQAETQATQKAKQQGVLLANFNPSAEILYRGLLRDVHEDTFHDASAMLLNLCACLVSLQHRFRSSAARLIQSTSEQGHPEGAVPGDDSAVEINVAVLSAVLRLFFPRKPREHLTSLKKLLHSAAQLHAVRTRDRLKKEAAAREGDEAQPNLQDLERSLPPSISLKEILCLPQVSSDGSMRGGHHILLDNLLRAPSPFIQELRRQHLLECVLSTEKLQRALRVNRRNPGGPSNDGENGQPTLTAKEIMEALNKADRDLTPDQRHVYLLRGFGRRLPDMPSMEASAGPLAEAYDSALRVHKVRKMLQDYCSELVESGASVGTDVFIRNLQSSGVIKGGKHWEPEFSLQDVATESGIVAMTVSNPTQPILDELISAHIASGTVQEDGIESSLSIPGSRGSPRHRAGSDRQVSKLANDRQLPAAPTAGCEPFEKYTFFAQLGRDVQEIGVGYPALFLSYWVKNSL